MLKDNCRDYAVAAFIRYARLGCPSRSEYEERLTKQLTESHPGERGAETVKRELIRAEPLLRDIDAVEKTIKFLRGEISVDVFAEIPLANGKEIADAITDVYFGLHREKPSQGRIGARVLSHALSKAYADERTVYRWLAKGREVFALIRGLVIEENKTKGN